VIAERTFVAERFDGVVKRSANVLDGHPVARAHLVDRHAAGKPTNKSAYRNPRAADHRLAVEDIPVSVDVFTPGHELIMTKQSFAVDIPLASSAQIVMREIESACFEPLG
jgi:hypothetical protein